MTTPEAFIAVHRFGMGPRPEELVTAKANPQRYVLDQMSSFGAIPASLSAFSSSRTRLEQITGAASEDRGAQRMARELTQNVALPELGATFTQHIVSDTPFVERMATFWANHFAVDRRKGYNIAVASSFATEAIRPHLAGRFEEMLFAATTHPAMVIYLDNILSVGPNSFFGKRRGRDINENLAREVLELHTLGVDGGYTQADVEALAAILTGWAVPNQRFARQAARMAERFRYTAQEDDGFATFIPLIHEPGAKTLLGKTYREGGADEYKQVCRDLAKHPSTARFIATKLVRHFVADTPPEAEVSGIADVFLETGGDLAAVTRAVVHLEAAWADPLAKAKSPQDFIVATARALRREQINPRHVNGALIPMGQQPLSPPSPQGWPDTADAWVAPGSLMRRIEYARATAGRVGSRLNPDRFLSRTLGEVASDDTVRLVQLAPSGEEAIAFVLASREFQRR